MAVKKVHDTITTSINRQLKDVKSIPKQAHTFWKSITPIRSGNARKRTKLNKNIITARYSYATELDKGSSKQAKRGMSEPTSKFIAKLLKKIMRK